jgi:hypothetical protein
MKHGVGKSISVMPVAGQYQLIDGGRRDPKSFARDEPMTTIPRALISKSMTLCKQSILAGQPYRPRLAPPRTGAAAILRRRSKHDDRKTSK